MKAPQQIAKLASPFAQLALHNVRQEYPNKLDHVVNGEEDLRSPRSLHPAFYGSFDWHSSVHMHWLLVRLMHLQPDLPEAADIITLFDLHFSPSAISGEVTYLEQTNRSAFERTYGWAWLLKLQNELNALSAPRPVAQRWADALQPLTDCFVERYLDFLPRARFPIRSGTHANSAWGLLFALDYAEAIGHQSLLALIRSKSLGWYGADQRYPAAYEPSAEDFLSGGLLEALLMQRVLEKEFASWWQQFCPDQQGLSSWLTPIAIVDRDDPRLCHLDGLNLSRAWCWRVLSNALPQSMQATVHRSIQAHLDTSLSHAGQGPYVGTHWLASFALLALSEPQPL